MLQVLRRGGLLVAGAVVIAAATSGCYREGPWPGASLDQFTYVSRTWEPKTITVVDTRTNESIWSVDIPVGQQLVVGFSKGTGPNEYTPDEIVWGLMPAGRMGGQRPNRMPCPPDYARRLDMAIRSTPEAVWSDVPGAANYRPEPRPIEGVGGRVVQPIEEPATVPPETTHQAPLPAPSPSDQPPNPTEPPAPVTEPAPQPPAAPAKSEEPAKKGEPATIDDPDVTEVPAKSDEPKKEEPPIDIPDGE